MSFLQAILMGIVQGATEFLPVSSSGHLAILKYLLNISQDKGISLEGFLMVGSLLILILLYRKDILKILFELMGILKDIFGNFRIMFYNTKTQENKTYIKLLHTNYRKFTVLILITSIFTGIFSFLLSRIMNLINPSFLVIGAGLFITGVFLLVTDYAPKGDKIPKDVSFRKGIFIGMIQGLSSFSGVSRTGSVVSCCLLIGFNRKLAMKYTMISAIPALIGSICFKFQSTTYKITSWKEGLFYLLAVITSAITSYFGIHFLQTIITRKRFRVLAYYCFFLGIIAIICNF